MSWQVVIVSLSFLAISAPLPALADTFHGYECTEDCSGHEAGYVWAEENDISDPNDCDGNSKSFIEGCEAWTEENGDDPLVDNPDLPSDGSEDQ